MPLTIYRAQRGAQSTSACGKSFPERTRIPSTRGFPLVTGKPSLRSCAKPRKVCPFFFGRSNNSRFGFDNYSDGLCHLNGRISIHLKWRLLVMRPEDLTMVATDSRASGAARALTSSPHSMAAMVALRYHAVNFDDFLQFRPKAPGLA